MIGILVLASILLGSSVSIILTPRIIGFLSLQLYTSDFSQSVLPNQGLAAQKTFDLVEIVLFFGLSIGFFLLNYYARKPRSIPIGILGVGSLLVFLQTHFVVHSIKVVLLQLVILELLYIVWPYKKKFTYHSVSLMNGLFVGFFLFVVTRLFTASYVIPFFIVFISPLVFMHFEWGRTAHWGFPFLVVSAFFPYSKLALVVIAIVSIVILKIKYVGTIESKRYYPYILLFIVIYNPLFFVGTFDSLEEGFWLAWVQRLSDGKVLYKNFAVYHPPLFTWGLSLFMRMTDYSLYTFRLYFHSLQILGTMIIAGFVMRVLTWRKLQIVTMLLILTFLQRNLMNNVEIRLGLGLLSLFPFLSYLESRKGKVLVLSGIFSGIALFSSVEVGIATIVSIVISIFFVGMYTKQFVIRLYGYFLAGLVGISVLIASILHYQGAFTEFVQQMIYVLQLFGSGYSNASIERTTVSNILLWNEVYLYLSSTAWLWELTRLSVLGSLLYVLYKRISHKLTVRDMGIFVTALFSLFLFRTALGRSDQYHLLTVFVPAVVLLAGTLERINRSVALIAIVVLIVITGQSQLNAYLQFNLEKYQSYATPAGIYPDYLSERTGIQAYPGTDTVIEDELVRSVLEETTTDDSIFVFPQKPELYFLTERTNATSFDTPIIYLTEAYQNQMIAELESTNPPLIVYNPDLAYYEISAEKLPLVNNFIASNYQLKKRIGDWQLLEPLGTTEVE